MYDNRELPIYQQIKEGIKHSIETGVYKPNEKIPAEAELGVKYSASRITVRRALDELSNDGYLQKKQGIGTFVSSSRIHRKLMVEVNLESFSNVCKTNNLMPGAKVLSRQIVPSKIDENSFLEIENQSLLIYIERVRTANGIPIFLENLFFDYTEFKNLLNVNLDDVSIFSVINEISGRLPSDTKKRTLEATKATKEQAAKLGISQGEPLFFLNLYMTDKEGKPIAIGRQYYIGSRYMFDL
ncbi:MAG: GntR family transcriptional regulator [Bacilli bacterium]